MARGQKKLTKNEKALTNHCIERAVKKLKEDGIDISIEEATDIYDSQMDFVKNKIDEGGLETITLPSFIKFSVSIPQYKAGIASSLRFSKARRLREEKEREEMHLEYLKRHDESRL